MRHIIDLISRIRLPALPLSVTLVVVVLVPFIGVVALTGAYSMKLLERNAEERMQEDIELIARSIQLPLSHAIERGYDRTIERALESAFTINRVYGVYVYDREGNTVYASGSEGATMQKQRAQVLAQSKDNQGEFFQAGDEQIFSYYVPLIDAGERIIGLLQVTRQGREFDQYLAEINVHSLTVIGIAGLLLSLIIVAGHRWVVGRHLAAVEHSLRHIQRDQFEYPLTPKGPRELRLLAQSINDLVVAIVRSRDQLHQQNQREAQLKERLHQWQKLAALGQLAAGVAHELGSPLSTIDGNAQRALREPRLPDKVTRALQAIRAQSSRMEHTIRQLLDYGRTNPLNLHTSLAAQPLLSTIKALEDQGFAEKEVMVDISPEAHATRINIDSVRLEQALFNLARNALQAAATRVQVRCTVDRNNIVYRIEDDGPGIVDDVLPHLFEPFYTTKPVGEGTGLGLAVAQAAARDHGGWINVVSSCPGATIMSLVLPIEEQKLDDQP